MRALIATLVAAAAAYGQSGFGGMGGTGSMAGSRGAIDGSQANQGMNLTPFLSLMGSYAQDRSSDSSVFSSGRTRSLTGLAGINGGRSWAHTVLFGGYVGSASYREYRGRDASMVQNHAAQLAVAHSISPRLTANFTQVAGTAIGGFGVGAGFGGFGGMSGLSSMGFSQFNQYASGSGASFSDPTVNGFVDSSVLDSRTDFAMSSGGLSYRLNSRWSMGGSGGAIFARRKGNLVDLNARVASGQATYLLNERSELMFQYNHSWMNYPGRFGGVQGRTLAMGYGRQFNPRRHFQIYGGVFDITSDFIGRVAIDPEIAAILGTGLGYETMHVSFRSFSGGLNFQQNWGKTYFQAAYNRGMIPGTDWLMASRRDMVNLTLGRTLARRFNANMMATGSRTAGKVGVIQTMDQYQITAGIGFRLVGSLSMNVNGGYRVLQVPGNPRISGVVAAAGLTWTPREWGLSF